jgi:hypothetical protein
MAAFFFMNSPPSPSRQPKESEIIFTVRISKGNRVLMLKFSKFI